MKKFIAIAIMAFSMVTAQAITVDDVFNAFPDADNVEKVNLDKEMLAMMGNNKLSGIKDISADDARQLATRFDFSGGQIENIARKRTVDYILSGKVATLNELEGYCRAELLNDKKHRSIGFNV